jgi:hypothetical protein
MRQYIHLTMSSLVLLSDRPPIGEFFEYIKGSSVRYSEVLKQCNLGHYELGW